jgi:hypothetical protein
VLGGQHYEKVVTAFERLRFGETFEVNFEGRLQEKHAVQRAFWVSSQHLL